MALQASNRHETYRPNRYKKRVNVTLAGKHRVLRCSGTTDFRAPPVPYLVDRAATTAQNGKARFRGLFFWLGTQPFTSA
jgi:hypothetical protein